MAPPSRRSQRAAAACCWAVLWGVIGACSLSDPLNGYSSGGPADKGPDGPADASDPAVSDGGPITDGFTDADGPASDVPFCSRQQPPPFFCVDFDEGDLTKAYQSGTVTAIPAPQASSGCTVTVADGGRSLPGAFLTEFPAAASGATLHVRYSQPSDAPAKGQTLQFDMKILTYQPGQEIDFVSLTMDGPNSQPQVRAYVVVQASGNGQLSVDNGSSYQSEDFTLPVDGQWHTYREEVDLVPSLRARLFLDDAPIPVADVAHTASFTSSPRASFYLGPAVVPPSSAVRIAMDNAFVRMR